MCYARGNGVEEDMKQAVEWWRKAAEQGDVSAQAVLGFCCLSGDGTAKNKKESVKWFRKAAAQGHSGAQQALKDLED